MEIRGFCQYQLGNKTEAEKDWNRLRALNQRKETTSFMKSIAEDYDLPPEMYELVYNELK